MGIGMPTYNIKLTDIKISSACDQKKKQHTEKKSDREARGGPEPQSVIKGIRLCYGVSQKSTSKKSSVI